VILIVIDVVMGVSVICVYGDYIDKKDNADK
jgi:hypothetical protein